MPIGSLRMTARIEVSFRSPRPRVDTVKEGIGALVAGDSVRDSREPTVSDHVLSRVRETSMPTGEPEQSCREHTGCECQGCEEARCLRRSVRMLPGRGRNLPEVSLGTWACPPRPVRGAVPNVVGLGSSRPLLHVETSASVRP